jgi:signal transduction histidine kinase
MVSPDGSAARVAPAFGRRLLLIMLSVAVVPLGAIGFWATRSASRSGRDLLRAQLDGQLALLAADVSETWERQRAELLMLGENEPVRLLLGDSSATDTTVPAFVLRAFSQTTAFDRVLVRDRSGRVRLTLAGSSPRNGSEGRGPSSAPDPGVSVRLPLTDLLAGDTIGSIEAAVRLTALVPAIARPLTREGPLLLVRTAGGMEVRAPEVDARVFADEDATWEGERWSTVERPVAEPAMVLALAGALGPYVSPFERAARRSALALFVASMLVAVVVVVLTRRLTRSVERELAHREALAAVGEFASELAHEVRNPLTAMRLDLQRAEERVDDPDTLRTVLPRVLGQIDRLDRAVSGALRVTRGGTIEPQAVDLASVLESARRSAEPEFARRQARLVMHPGDGGPLGLSGDAGALEQMFLNLLINASQALSPGGEAHVSTSRHDGHVDVTIRDTGTGMTAARLAELSHPYRSSRRDGTGLGVRIARRIATNHGGELAFESDPGMGTTARVRLPVER